MKVNSAAAVIAADMGMHQRRGGLQQHQQHNQKLTQICNHLRFRNVCELAYPAKPRLYRAVRNAILLEKRDSTLNIRKHLLDLGEKL